MNNDDIPDELKDLMDEEPNVIDEVEIDENVLNTPDLSKMLEMVQNMSPQQRNDLLSNISQKAGINPDNKFFNVAQIFNILGILEILYYLRIDYKN